MDRRSIEARFLQPYRERLAWIGLKDPCHDNAHEQPCLTTKVLLTNTNQCFAVLEFSFAFENLFGWPLIFCILERKAASCTSPLGHQTVDVHLKILNMSFKSSTNDQTVIQYRYYNFHKTHKVDGKRFSSPKPTLKSAPSDKKSNRCICAVE